MTISLSDLTEATLEGTGVFDVLMQANKAHLESEFQKNRIKGTEYADVYLGSLTQVMQTALAFLLAKEKTNLEAQLLQKQIDLAQVQIDKTNAEKAQTEAQTLLIGQQRENLAAEGANILKQGVLLDAQAALSGQQRTNLAAEALNIPKQGALIDAQVQVQVANKAHTEGQTQLVAQQKSNLIAELSNIPKQGLLIEAQTLVQQSNKAHTDEQTLLIAQQKSNLLAEANNIPKQGLLIDAQKEVQLANKAHLDADTLLVDQKKLNAVTENTVLVAQEVKTRADICVLQAQFDLTKQSVLKATEETSLLAQKMVTEKAQTTALAVDADSVVGRQKGLYLAQSTGFTRDAEQKAAKLLADSWSVRRTTDDTVEANPAHLGDTHIARAIDKLLAGVGA